MVGDLGKSLWLREIFGSVHGEKRPLCHIGHSDVIYYVVFMADVIAMWWVVDVKPLSDTIVADVIATVAGGIANFYLFSIFPFTFMADVFAICPSGRCLTTN